MLKHFKLLTYSNVIITLLFIYLGIVYFSIAISNIAMGLGILAFIIGVSIKKLDFSFDKQQIINYTLIIVPFILTIISVLLSENTMVGMEYIWLRLPILLIPFIILTNNKVEYKDLKKGVFIFVLLTMLASLVCLYNAFELFFDKGEFLDPSSASNITLIQHPYFGIFNLLAILLLIEFKLYRNKIQLITIISILGIGVILSTSRLVYLFSLSIILIYSFRKLSTRWAIIVILATISISSTAISLNDNIRYKITRTWDYDNSPRLWLWNNTYKVIKNSKHPLLGTGIGDFYSEQKDPYYFRESKNGTMGYNPHNQYLEFILTNGIFGLLFIISMLILLYRIKNYSIELKMIFVLIMLFAFTESIFNRQYGVQLYSVFIPMLLVNFLKTK